MNPFITLLIIFCCVAVPYNAACQSGKIIHLTDSNSVVIPYKKSEFDIFKNVKATTLTKKEIQEIEVLLNDCIEDNKLEKNYQVQMVPVINKKGEKEVWLNCFCNSSSDSRKEISSEIRDGGSCHINLKVNLTTKRYYDLIRGGQWRGLSCLLGDAII